MEIDFIHIRAATTTKASKAQALPKFWVTVNPISIRGADYAHHSTMGLVWLKFAVAPLARLGAEPFQLGKSQLEIHH